MRKYICMTCNNEDVKKTTNISKKYEDDYLLECSCGNWEEVGNNRPSVFEEIIE